MKIFRKYFFLSSIIPLFLFAEIITDGTLSGRSDGTNIIISWKSDNENDLKQFVVERKLFNASSYIDLAILKPKGNNTFYQFIDESAFKTSSSVYSYRIRIEMQNGSTYYTQSFNVAHHVSSVKRTWGSLKAMFR
ncbi:MAG: hypothetical protein EXR24_01510 [Ignavibacteria bacterium]|nr:hypothetical protein [Bacteroidota bacterium]MSQ45645.1 hypothetical protein [Ignavibacteria bacterium]